MAYPLKVVTDTTPDWLDVSNLDVHNMYVHSTNIHTMDRCDRLAFFEHVLGLRFQSYRAALAIGSVFHVVCEQLYTTGEVDTQALIDVQNAKLAGEADQYGLLQNGAFLGEKQTQVKEDFLKAEAMARTLYALYPLDLEHEWEIVSLEELVDVDLDIDGVAVQLRGRLDKVLRSRETGELWILDYKTEGMDVKTRCATFPFDSQVRLYRLLLQARYPDAKIGGAIHYVVKKPSIRICGKDNWEFKNYLKRVKDWYKDQEGRSDTPAVAVSKVRFTEPIMTDEFATKLMKAHRLSHPRQYEQQINMNDYPKNDQACRGKFGVCPYIDLCRSSASTWPEEIDRRFQQVNRDAEEEANYASEKPQDTE